MEPEGRAAVSSFIKSVRRASLSFSASSSEKPGLFGLLYVDRAESCVYPEVNEILRSHGVLSAFVGIGTRFEVYGFCNLHGVYGNRFRAYRSLNADGTSYADRNCVRVFCTFGIVVLLRFSAALESEYLTESTDVKPRPRMRYGHIRFCCRTPP